MKPYKLVGRAFFGIFMDLVYGLLLFGVVVIFALAGLDRLFKDFGFTAIFLFISGFTIMLFVHLFQALRHKTLEIDGIGIRYYVGKKQKWDFLWTEIESVFTSAMGGRYPRSGFGIKAKNETVSINDRDDIGPREKLVEAFRIIAKEAVERGISIADNNGWAGDIIPKTLQNKEILRYRDLEGKWHLGVNSFKPIKLIFGILILPIIIVGIILIFLFPQQNHPLVPWGYMLFFVGIILLPILGVLYGTTIIKVWFDEEEIRLMFPWRREVSAKWSEVKKLGLNPDVGYFAVWLKNGKSWSGFFSKEVCEAAQVRFALNQSIPKEKE